MSFLEYANSQRQKAARSHQGLGRAGNGELAFNDVSLWDHSKSFSKQTKLPNIMNVDKTPGLYTLSMLKW